VSDERPDVRVRDRLTAAGLSDERIEQHMTAGRVRVDGELVTDLDTPARWDAGRGLVVVTRQREDAVVRRILDDPAAVYLWVAVTLAAVVVAVVAGEPVLAVAGWVVGSVAAVVLVAVKARRGR